MEPAFHDHEQSQDNEESPICLRFPLILREIMCHCSNGELLQLSLVNKQWNYEARSMMKDRGVIVNLGTDEEPCQELATFALRLGNTNVAPFCGISIKFDLDDEEENHEKTCLAWPIETMNVIFEKLPWKRFAVCFSSDWELFQNCSAFRFVKRILQDYCGTLEGLSLCVRGNYDEFIKQVLPNSQFQRLKTLQRPGRIFSSLDWDERMFLKTLVSRAPNLKQLILENPIDCFQDLLQGSTAVLVVKEEIDPIDNTTCRCRGPIDGLRLRRMRLGYGSNRNFSMDRLNRIVPVVLETSRTELKSLTFNSVFAPSLMRYGIRLENVTKLQMCLNRKFDELDVPQCVAAALYKFVTILRNFDFSRIFPKLKQVEVTSTHWVSPWEISQFVDQENVILPSVDRAINIKHLSLKCSPINVPFLASMFPHVEKLAIEIFNGPVPTFGLIWELWTHLKQLDLDVYGVCRENLDSLFCGLHPEEIAQLREKDEQYLKTVNIVPVMPSITCVKELRAFTLRNTGCGFFHGENDPTFVFSKVTALIGFSRCPNLSVTLQIKSKWENAWSHMKDYASIVFV